MKNILLPASIIILALSVALGSFFIAAAMKDQGKSTVAAAEITAGKAAASKTLLSEQEAADYLGLPKETFHKLAVLSGRSKYTAGGNSTEYPPYMKIDDDYYFIKSELDKWAAQNVAQYSELKTS